MDVPSLKYRFVLLEACIYEGESLSQPRLVLRCVRARIHPLVPSSEKWSATSYQNSKPRLTYGRRYLPASWAQPTTNKAADARKQLNDNIAHVSQLFIQWRTRLGDALARRV
mgnify:CR=1 FL=1